MRELTTKWYVVAVFAVMLTFGCNDGCSDGTLQFGGNGGGAEEGDTEGEGPFTDESGDSCDELSACGDCDHDCRIDGYNPGSGDGDGDGGLGGFGEGSGAGGDSQGSGVIETDDGIEVDVQKIESHYIWIANTGEGTVSKIDTRTYEEVGRYISGPDGVNNDPSRTSVNSYADVFVGNRRGLSVTKISSRGEDCPDTNGDGQITTSSGPDDVLPWGEDDCVLWNKRLPDGDIIRAVAAQDVRSRSHSDDAVIETAQPAVWIGGWDGVAWKLDGETGEVILRTTTPVRPYGFALDGSGNLWISSREQAFGRIDTNRCTDEASCNTQVCDEAGDDCVKQRIAIDAIPYGITVDHKQRVWLGGDKLTRYDAQEPLGQRLTYVEGSGSSIWLHGVQADLEGYIWASAYSVGAMRFDAENPSDYTVVDATQGSTTKGVAVDLDGKVWSINMQTSDAHVITPGQALEDNPVVHTQTDLVQPYTYSDMTGSQLRFATDQTGFFRRTFGGCPDTDGTDWLQLRWDATVPDGTQVKFLARAAEEQDGLQGTPWVAVADVPPDQSPTDIGAVLDANGMGGLRYMQVEAQLTAVRQPDGSHVTPTLHALEVTFHCGPPGGNGFGDDNNGTGDGSGGDGSGDGDGSGGDGDGNCVPSSGVCSDNGDCCSGVCGAGVCIEQ